MKDMLGRTQAVSVDRALSYILANTPQACMARESVGLEQAFGRVLAESVVSPEDLPGFARSTVDGFALRAEDTFGATETGPAYLTLKHEIAMGEEPGFTLGPGEAAKIATGGMLPDGADAVLMFEHAQLVRDVLEAQTPLGPGDNVIQKGEDIKKGHLLLEAGAVLRPQDVAASAGLGLVSLDVYVQPRVSIISTGDEIIPPSEPLRPGLVRDSNSYALMGNIFSEGCKPVMRGIIKDEFELIRDAVSVSVRETEAVLIIGGSSVGTRDMAERVVQELGEVVFHSVTIRPGKPMLFGVVEGKPVFGLPGHPRAVQVCFDVFVRPCLRQMCGVAGTDSAPPAACRAKLARSLSSPAGRQDVVPVRIEARDDGLWAVPLLGRSGLILSMVRAHGEVMIPVGSEKGEEVDVLLR